MKSRSLIALVTMFLVFGAGFAKAQEEPIDPVSCADEQVAVTFADGNTATTMCVDTGSEMDPTEESDLEGVIDPGNYD